MKLKEEFSFQPDINPYSKSFFRPPGERTEDALINYGKQKKEKIE